MYVYSESAGVVELIYGVMMGGEHRGQGGESAST